MSESLDHIVVEQTSNGWIVVRYRKSRDTPFDPVTRLVLSEHLTSGAAQKARKRLMT